MHTCTPSQPQIIMFVTIILYKKLTTGKNFDKQQLIVKVHSYHNVMISWIATSDGGFSKKITLLAV